MNNDDQFTTSDLCITATLSLVFPILETERSNPKRILFVFTKTPQLSAYLDEFTQGKLTVEPQAFFNQIGKIKARIYNNY